LYQEHTRLIDPHTAVAMVAAGKIESAGAPVVVLSTAHPAKFPDAVRRATGVAAELPVRLRDIRSRKERYETLPADGARIRAFIERELRN